MKDSDLQGYRKHVADTYDGRSARHEASTWHRKTALKLVEDLPPGAGDSVLDIGTGTGFIAFHVTPQVGNDGRVVGVDLSAGMLAQAQKKLAGGSHRNLWFIRSDAERLGFPDDSFDRIYCASAFFCVLDPLAALQHWLDLLKPGGGLAFHALPETSYLWVSVARDVLSNYGYSYLLNTPTGSVDKTRRLLNDAGYRDIDIREERSGSYLPLEEARKTWLQRDDFAPGQHPHPLDGVPAATLDQCRRDYEASIEQLNTDKGVWNDTSMYYVYARK